MRQRHIGDGRTTLTVSEICLGTMLFGYRTDERTSFAILDRFLEAGGTFLDTANNYGQWHGDAGESERVLGRWMRSRGVTDRMVIASKVGARTLQRLFASYVGVSPKWVLSRYRMHDVVTDLDAGYGGSLADLAAKYGWFDQAHFTREFTDLVVMQRGYQASSQVISTANDMLQELFRMKAK